MKAFSVCSGWLRYPRASREPPTNNSPLTPMGVGRKISEIKDIEMVVREKAPNDASQGDTCDVNVDTYSKQEPRWDHTRPRT